MATFKELYDEHQVTLSRRHVLDLLESYLEELKENRPPGIAEEHWKAGVKLVDELLCAEQDKDDATLKSFGTEAVVEVIEEEEDEPPEQCTEEDAEGT